jgi:hypothetical protein
MSRRLIALAICIALAGPAQSEKLTASKKSAAKWRVNIAPAQCTLTGAVDHAVASAIAVSTVPGSGAYVVTLAGGTLHRRTNLSQAPVSIGFDLAGDRLPGSATFLRLKEGGRAIRIAGLPATFPERFERASTISVEGAGGPIGPVAISGAAKAKAISALKTCVTDQLVEWGANPEQFKPGGIPTAAKADPDSWLTPAQLRKLPIIDGDMDLVLKLSITPEGVVDGCEQVAGPTNAPASKMACGMLQTRSLFAPARDAAGVPIRGVGAHRIQLFQRDIIG